MREREETETSQSSLANVTDSESKSQYVGKIGSQECGEREKQSRRHHLESECGSNYWARHEAPSALCRVDDGIPNRSHRLRALGNAIVPQCSEYIGRLLLQSGLL